jgi:tyrosine-protein kinase Etk/Wzc
MKQDCIASPLLTAPEGLAASQVEGPRREVTILEVLTELAQRRALIAKITGGATVIGITLSLVLPVRYKATTRILPPQQTQSAASLFMSQIAGSGANPLATMAGAGLGLKSPSDLYVGMLQSQTVADALIHQFDLTRVYRSRDRTQAREQLAQNTMMLTEKSGLISIEVTDRDRNRAAALANSYAVELRTLTQSLAVSEASERRLFYEDQLKQAKEALVAAEIGFQQVQQQKGLVALDAQAKVMIESVAMLRAQAAAKQVEVQALRSYSTEQNPDVQLAEQELSTLQGEAARVEQRSGSQERGSLGLEDVPSAGLEYLRAQHELVYRQALYDLLIKQLDAARLDESKEAAIIQVVDPATVPDRKSVPHRGLIILLSALLGIFSGVFYLLAAMALERARQNPEVAVQLRMLRAAVLHRGSA